VVEKSFNAAPNIWSGVSVLTAQVLLLSHNHDAPDIGLQ
jgi:hypothetical protein